MIKINNNKYFKKNVAIYFVSNSSKTTARSTESALVMLWYSHDLASQI